MPHAHAKKRSRGVIRRGNGEISTYINANLPRLERFIQRELQYRFTAGILEPDELTCDEVLDEAVATALSDSHKRPHLLSPERWMYRLALKSMERVSRSAQPQSGAVPLEVSARKQNVRGSDEPELQFHQPDETLTGESTIADNRVATPEEIAYSDEMVLLVERSLRSVPAEDREAFILHVLEGFTLEEITAITDRSQKRVRASVAVAREHVKRSLPVGVRDRIFSPVRIA